MSARFWATGLAMVALACGGSKAPPDPITRELDVPDAPQRNETKTVLDDTDDAGGSYLVDAGVCCPVPFAVAAANDDVAVSFVSSNQQRSAMSRDGGGWYGTVCMPLEQVYYRYEALVATGDEDGGLFPLSRVNSGVATVVGSTTLFNVYDPNGATGCSQLDAGIHAVVPDAGS